MKRTLAVLAVLSLTACSRPAQTTSAPSASDAAVATSATAESAPAAAMGSARGRTAATPAAQGGETARPVLARPEPPPAPGQAPVQVPAAPTTPLLAYSYRYQIQAPSDRARALMARHQQACTAAGPALCQVVNANQSQTDEEQFTGTLAIRAAPAWLDRFRAGLEADAAGAGGRIVAANTDSEDLTRAIVDTDATLRAQTTLRTRLEQLLATRQGELSELLEVQRELARVQGEIDGLQSELAVMRTRVATSAVTLQYGSRGVLATPGVFDPVTDAITSGLRILAGSLGALIVFLFALAPWALAIGGLLWLFRKRLPKFGRRPAAAPVVPPPPAQTPPPSV